MKKRSSPEYIPFYVKIFPDYVTRRYLFLALMIMLAFRLYMVWAYWVGMVR